MAKQFSFTKYENEILPKLREKTSKAESTEDIKKFFVQAIKELIGKVFAGKIEFEYEDISLMIESEPNYKLSNRLYSSKEFKNVWNDSDLSRVITRFAKTAINRYRHLEKHPEKTDAKIRL
ncbi:MAG: hypothetical protein DRH24_05920 [Deltaproteobacteria bacterium]|nr:MAG: hypothetical protein DRH24_05920 [Deltaproteobacteria bacterium]